MSSKIGASRFAHSRSCAVSWGIPPRYSRSAIFLLGCLIDDRESSERAGAEKRRKCFRFVRVQAAGAFVIIGAHLSGASISQQHASMNTFIDCRRRFSALVQRFVKALVEVDRAFRHPDLAQGRMIAIKRK